MTFKPIKATVSYCSHSGYARKVDVTPYRDIPVWVLGVLSQKPHNCFVNISTFNEFKLSQLEEYFGVGNIELKKYENGYIITFLKP